MNKEFEDWLAGSPEVVQTMARRYPPGTGFLSKGGKVFYVVSYTEAGGICVSDINRTEPPAK